MLLSTRRPIFSPLAVTIMTLGAGPLGPSSADAECGGYIVYTDPARKPVDLLPMSEHRAPIGCHGPNCSKVPTPAPSPQAPPTLRVLVDETLFVSTGDSLVPPTFQSVPADSTDGAVVRRAADVYHPPR